MSPMLTLFLMIYCPMFKHMGNMFIYMNMFCMRLKFVVARYYLEKMAPFKHSQMDALLIFSHTIGWQCDRLDITTFWGVKQQHDLFLPTYQQRSGNNCTYGRIL